MELQSSGRCAQVDTFTKTDEPDADLLQIFEEHHEMSQVPSEPVQTPAHHHTKPPPPSIQQHCVQCGPTVLRPRHARVHELPPHTPAASLAISAEFEELVLARLVRGR